MYQISCLLLVQLNINHHHHHKFSAQGQVLGFQILQLSRFAAFLFISPYVSSNTSSIMPILGFPLGLFPSILPSSTNFIRPSPLITCPIQFFFLSHIVFIKLLFSFMELSTCSFVLLSIQLTFPILIHTHISKAFKRFISSLLMVHPYRTTHTEHPHPYRTTGHTSVLTNLFLRSNLIPGETTHYIKWDLLG